MKVRQDFSPYSEWLYFKVYCGFKSAEGILSNQVFEWVIDNKDLYEKFFFIRYSDDAPHFRIRFYNTDLVKQLDIFASFSKMLEDLTASGVIDKIVIDTYKRELSRYGENTIVEAECLFHYDSLCVLKMVNLLSQIESPEKYRVLMALRGIDELLNDFNLKLEEKGEFAKTIQASFFREFGGQIRLQQQLNKKYRDYKKLVFSHMNFEKDAENEIEEAISFFNERSEMGKESVKNMLKANAKKENLYSLLSSLIHMYMNRLFVSQQRKYELLIYHFLEKYYASQIAIQKYSKK